MDSQSVTWGVLCKFTGMASMCLYHDMGWSSVPEYTHVKEGAVVPGESDTSKNRKPQGFLQTNLQKCTSLSSFYYSH